MSLTIRGDTATLTNSGQVSLWWPYRIDAWAGPPWRNVRPSEGEEFLNALAPGESFTWTFEPSTGPVRVAARLWPDQARSGRPWYVWADLPAREAARPTASGASEYPWVLGIANATTMTVTLVVNGNAVATIAPSQGLGDGIPRSKLPPLPWLVEARSPGGHVLVSMTVRDGDVWQSTRSDGGGGLSAPAARVDLACGRVDIWVGAEMAGPMPPPSAPPCPP